MMNFKNLGQNVTVQANFLHSSGSNTKWLRLARNDFSTLAVECINLAHVSKVSYEKQRNAQLFKLGLFLCAIAWIFVFLFLNWVVFGIFIASGSLSAILAGVLGKSECFLWLNSVHKVEMRNIRTRDEFERFFDQLTNHMNSIRTDTIPSNVRYNEQNFGEPDAFQYNSNASSQSMHPESPYRQPATLSGKYISEKNASNKNTTEKFTSEKSTSEKIPSEKSTSEKKQSEKPSVSSTIRQKISEKREPAQGESQTRSAWSSVRERDITSNKTDQDIFDQTSIDQPNTDNNNDKNNRENINRDNNNVNQNKIGVTNIDLATIDLTILNKIAEFGDLDLPLNQIDLSDLDLSDLEGSKEVLNQINNLQPNERNKIGSHNLWVKVGRVFQKYGDYAYAEICYRTALSLDSKNARTWARLAYVVDDEKKRNQCLKLAIQLDPKLTDEEL